MKWKLTVPAIEWGRDRGGTGPGAPGPRPLDRTLLVLWREGVRVGSDDYSSGLSMVLRRLMACVPPG